MSPPYTIHSRAWGTSCPERLERMKDGNRSVESNRKRRFGKYSFCGTEWARDLDPRVLPVHLSALGSRRLFLPYTRW